jgi:hypothetical protein
LYCDPQIDPSGKLYDANIQLFRLAYILGDIMDDAVSLRPVPYDSILAKDRHLQEWWDTLPPELDMDGYLLVNCLTSPTISKRCIGVQSVVVRTAFLHVRFAMHRHYASLARSERSKYAKSLEISFGAAEKLIALSAHARPETLNHTAVSMHMGWSQMHSFSAAMFFCFQIINKPQQAGVARLRAHVLRAIRTLESFSGVRLVEKALDILRALGPLYAEEFLSGTPEDRERKKQTVLPAVRKLQFPCVDSLIAPVGAANEVAGSANRTFSHAQSRAYTDSPQSTGPAPDLMWTVQVQEPEIQSQVPPVAMLQPHQQPLLHQQHQQQPRHPTRESLSSLEWSHADVAVVGDPAQYPGQRQQGDLSATRHEPQQYRDALPRQLVGDEEAMWQSAAAHHSPTTVMVASEPTGATNVASPSRAELYTQQHMMGQQQGQDVYSQQGGGGDGFGGGYGAGDGTGLSIVAESVLWGASGFVQGEWDRMYTELGCHT